MGDFMFEGISVGGGAGGAASGGGKQRGLMLKDASPVIPSPASLTAASDLPAATVSVPIAASEGSSSSSASSSSALTVGTTPTAASAAAAAAGAAASRRFYFSRAGFDYTLPDPSERTLAAYTAAVEALPLLNGPGVLGLHANAEIGYFTTASKALWANAIDLQPRASVAAAAVVAAAAPAEGSGGGTPPTTTTPAATVAPASSRDASIRATVREIQAAVPPLVDIIALRRRFLAAAAARAHAGDEYGGGEGLPGSLPPISIVLLQELEGWNALVDAMSTSLSDLIRALNGEIGLSDALEEVASSLVNGRLPSLWRNKAPATEKSLGPWMAHFGRRHAQYVDWIASGGRPPAVIWLAGLQVPVAFLTALVQTTCRRKGWALDRASLATRVTSIVDPSSVTAPPEDGCYVTGVYLEGAGWDIAGGRLVTQTPKQLVVELPLLHIVPIEATRASTHGTFKTPVYVTQSRRNAMGVGLVTELNLPTTEHASHWALAGVACCLNVD